MKKRVFTLLMCLCVCLCLASCSGGQIEKDIKAEIEGINNISDKTIAAIEKKGIGELSDYEIDTAELIATLLEKVSINIEVEEKENSAMALLTITRFDMQGANELLKEKAIEFRSSEKVIDVEKADRYQTGKDDLNQVIEATETTDVEVKLEFKKDGELWKTDENIYTKVLDTIISDEEAKAFVEAYKKGYTWKFDDKNAGQIAEILKDSGMNIGEIQSFNADTDPGEMLGRPGGYLSKANFLDKELQKKGESYMIKHDGVINYSYGGTIEVFETAELAKNRGDYLENLSVTTPYNKYYTYRFCNVVFRVGDEATPAQAQKYADVFYENE